MKKYLFIIAVLSYTAAQSQGVSDALRYAQDNFNGTARFRAMGGAMGALGGDLSAINVNPAGSAIFTANVVGLSLTSYNTNNKSKYFGTNTTENDYTFDLNQAGGVYIIPNDDENSGWKKFTLALNYENINNFDNTLFSAGTNPTNSIGNYFLNYANQNGGVPLNTLQNSYYEDLNYDDAQAFLGYQAYIINPVADTPNNTQYVSNIPVGDYYQEKSFVSTGYNGKVNFNVATSYKDKLYLGLNLNSHFTDYRQSTSFYEENDNNTAGGVQRLRFNNNLYTYGTGFSFQLGAIAKVTNELRLGLAYESPTWYRLNDELSQNLVSVRVDPDTDETLTAVVDPNITMLYDTYKLQTPGKFTASAAYVFGKEGLISIDYSIKDYGNTQFRPDNEFTNANDQMSSELTQAGELRIGAEKRIKQWSLRGGYRMEESPYKNGKTIGDLTSFSGGLGYNFGNVKLDLAYTYAQRDYENAVNDITKAVNNNVSVTLLFELE
ncbi:MAG TPA: outer membrane protein transport protein [Flavobacterium sp.]|nr:outer membrane protein transport protein [Flavobacterium sp.]